MHQAICRKNNICVDMATTACVSIGLYRYTKYTGTRHTQNIFRFMMIVQYGQCTLLLATNLVGNCSQNPIDTENMNQNLAEQKLF